MNKVIVWLRSDGLVNYGDSLPATGGDTSFRRIADVKDAATAEAFIKALPTSRKQKMGGWAVRQFDAMEAKEILADIELWMLRSRVDNVLANAGHALNDAEEHRLLGVQQAFLAIRRERNHIEEWLKRDEAAIRKLHTTRSTPCDCAVCRVPAVLEKGA